VGKHEIGANPMAVSPIEHIAIDEQGRASIVGTEITVQEIVYWRSLDLSPEQIAETLELTYGQVYAALSYYFDHQEQIDRELAQDLADDDAKWDESFAKSHELLDRLGREALERDRAGETIELDPDNLGNE
jgi:uncharacterized protein (DUF433 family)